MSSKKGGGRREREKTSVEEKRVVEVLEIPLDVPRELYDKLVNDVKRGAFKVLTPYSLAKEYNVKVSVARKLLKVAAKAGILKLYSGGRRSPIYVAG